MVSGITFLVLKVYEVHGKDKKTSYRYRTALAFPVLKYMHLPTM